MAIAGYIAAVLMGLSLGIVGGGGSILTVPILIYFFGRDALVATTESLFIVGATALVGGVLYARKNLVDFKSGIIFAIPSFLGVYVARHVLLPRVPGTLFTSGDFTFTKELLVLISFATLMLFASFSMIRKRKAPAPARSPDPARIASRGLFVGCVTGFVGAGGGFLIIPALVVLLRLPMRTAVGTSLLIIASNSLFGFSISFGSHVMDWPTLLSVAGLGIFGLLAGYHLSARVPEDRLKKGFGYFVLIVGLALLFDQLRR